MDKASEQALDYYMDFFELANREDEIVHSLSRGMKKKVALLRTMIHEPRLLILDEPLNGLDPVMEQLFLGKICFVVGVTAVILGLIFGLQLITINAVNLVREGSFIYPYTGFSTFMFWVSNLGIASFIATFGGLISINTQNVKSCNLIVVLVSSPALAPLVIGLSTQSMSFSTIRMYSYGLYGVSLLLFAYVVLRYTKKKVMAKL